MATPPSIRCFVWEDSTRRLPHEISLSPTTDKLKILDGDSRAMSLAGTSTVLRSYAWDEVTQFSGLPAEDPTDMDVFAFWTKSDEIKVEVDECKALCDMFESNIGKGTYKEARQTAHLSVMEQLKAGGITLASASGGTSSKQDLMSQIRAGTQLKNKVQGGAPASLLAQIQQGTQLKSVEAGSAVAITGLLAQAGLLAQIHAGKQLKPVTTGSPAPTGLLAEIQAGLKLKPAAGPPAQISSGAAQLLAQAGLLSQIHAGLKLKPVTTGSPAPSDLLAEIQAGMQLKPMSSTEKLMARLPSAPGGLLTEIQAGLRLKPAPART